MKPRFFGFWPRRTASFPAGETIHSDKFYRVTYRQGEGDVVVLAFCGVGLKTNGIQIEEFRSSIGTSSSVYYIADLHRSWWNNGQIEGVVETILKHATAQNAASLYTTLGNSMGGSGALLASHLYPEIQRCLAFVPQADIRSETPETRWAGYRRRIAKHRWPSFALLPSKAQQRIVFGSGEDDWQRSQFVAANRNVIIFDGHGHDVAKQLKEKESSEYADLLRFALLQ